MKSLLFILLIIGGLFLTVFLVKRKLKDKTETITCFTGGLGSGKTWFSVFLSRARYQLNLSKWYRKKVLFIIKNAFRKKENKKVWTYEKPVYLTSIPVGIKKVRNKLTGKKEWLMSMKLEIEHLLLQKRIPLGSVVFIDEVGSVASQYDFSKHNVKDVMAEFFRLFRHYVSNPDLKIQSYLYVNDQCSNNINLEIRRRINIVHNLSNFKILFGHLVFYFDRQICISDEITTMDVKQDVAQSDTQDNATLHFKFVWFMPKYDTYCYHNRYLRVPKKDVKPYTQFRKDELMTCPFDISYQPKTEKIKKSKKKGE